MTEYKVLFLDIDGTILTRAGEIKSSTKHALNTVRQKGVEVFLATGRPLHEIAWLAEKLNIHSFIGYNGACALYKEEVIVYEPMKEKTVADFLATAEKHKHELLFYSSSNNIFTSLDSPVSKELIKHLRFKHNKTFSSEDEKDILSISLLNVTENDLKHYAMDDEFHFAPVLAESQNGKNFYDVIRENVTKGSAVQKLLHRLSIPAECAIAFGDGLNDKEMLAAVGEGFAMGNANPLLFHHAKHVTATVSDDGIYRGLKQLRLVD